MLIQKDTIFMWVGLIGIWIFVIKLIFDKIKQKKANKHHNEYLKKK